MFVQRVKSGREGSARGRREGSAGSAGECVCVCVREGFEHLH